MEKYKGSSMRTAPTKIITKRPDGSLRVASVFTKPSRTQQQFKDECNINKIMEKYRKTGMVTHLRNGGEGVYADLSQVGDYQDMVHRVMHANEEFLKLPSEIRTRFGNDPQNLVDFLKDPKNTDEAIKLNLRKRVEPPKDPNQTIIDKLEEISQPRKRSSKE